MPHQSNINRRAVHTTPAAAVDLDVHQSQATNHLTRRHQAIKGTTAAITTVTLRATSIIRTANNVNVMFNRIYRFY